MQIHLGIKVLEPNIPVTNPAIGKISSQLNKSKDCTWKLCLKADCDGKMAEYKLPIS